MARNLRLWGLHNPLRIQLLRKNHDGIGAAATREHHARCQIRLLALHRKMHAPIDGSATARERFATRPRCTLRNAAMTSRLRVVPMVAAQRTRLALAVQSTSRRRTSAFLLNISKSR